MSVQSASVIVSPETSGPAIRPEVATTWIYFQALHGGKEIKIGQSTKGGERRAKTERNGSYRSDTLQIDLLCEVKGKASDERFVQVYFKKLGLWLVREIYKPGEELVDYIRWLRDMHFVAMPDMSQSEREGLESVPADFWLPSAERRKPRPQGVLPGMLGMLDLGDREITGDDFYTNELIIEAARRVMGRIDVDPASHAIANKVVKASRFYTVRDDGLTFPWAGKVWLNPPFSQWEAWVPKVLGEWRSGRVEEMCVLSAMRTVTAQYFAALLESCEAMCITKGRIKFWGGVAGESPDDGHAIYYFGPKRELFRREFSGIGTVFYGVGK